MTWIIVAAAVFVNFYLCKDTGTAFDASANYMEITEAFSDSGETMSLPAGFSMSAGESMTVSFVLPDELREGYGFMYSSNYSVSVVLIDGEEVGGYGQTLELPYGSMIGNIRVIIPVDETDAGKTVTLTFTSPYYQNYTLNPIKVGAVDSLRFDVFRHNIWVIGLCCYLFALLLLAGGISLHHGIQGRTGPASMYHCLVGFIICVIVWIFCSSDLPQFVTGKNAPVSFFSFLSLTLMGPAFLGYCSAAMPCGTKAYYIVGRLGLLLPLVNIALYMANVCDPVNLMYITHIYLAGSIVLVTVNCFIGMHRKAKGTGLLFAGILCLMASAVAALVVFYRDPMGTTASAVLGVGFAVFVFFMMTSLLNKEDSLIGESAAGNAYRELAYKDYLTGSGNRAAFEQELEKAADNGAARITLVMFDLNRLKTTNDELGHQVGDEMICGITSCISQAFTPEGKCYRLGGDEFATILWDRKCEVEEYLAELDQIIERYNTEHVIPLSVATGYAEGDNPRCREGINKIYTAADKNMYRDKLKCHEQMDAAQVVKGEN